VEEPIKDAVAISPLRARLRKRQRHLKRWAAREGLTAYRLFDRDLPGYHFAVDRYDRYAVVAEYPWKAGNALDTQHRRRREELVSALELECGVEAKDLVLKTHERQAPGKGQYERTGADLRVVVSEGPLRFEVNLGPYLDVGLFLDHRTTRRLVHSRSAGKRVLNLFAYTGAFTVAAAVGGASRTVSVDLSKRYLDWARRNLDLNRVSGEHALVESDVMAFVRGGTRERYDLIVCDPPPSSTSSRAQRFEIQRHHEELLLELAGWLTERGAILFSSNLGGFTLSPKVLERLPGRELTPDLLPEDFRVSPHRAWLLGDPWLVASR
jgi:23S rRNA (cytosine1962-C5)-methyltransferase